MTEADAYEALQNLLSLAEDIVREGVYDLDDIKKELENRINNE